MSSTTGVANNRIEEVVGELTDTDRFRERGSTERLHGKGQQDARIAARNECSMIARQPLDRPSQEHDRNVSYHCPICRNVLPHLAALPPFDAPCFKCGSFLWCRRARFP
jgi:hypothetical protein